MRLLGAAPDSRVEALPGRAATLRFAFFIACLGLLAVFVSPPAKVEAQGLGQWVRVVQGKVVDTNNKPQPNAIVYLQNQKTQEIKTYITPADGTYRFGQLSTDADYEIWAKSQNEKSKTRSISSFDSKKQFIFILKLEPSK